MNNFANDKDYEHAKRLQRMFKTLGFNYSVEDLLNQQHLRVDEIVMCH